MRTLLTSLLSAALVLGALACGSSEQSGSSSGSSSAASSGASGTGSGSGSSGTSSSSGSGSTGSGSSSGSSGTSGETGPITGLPSEQWTWVPFADSMCRDGSATGIGVNLNPGSTKLMIFLEGGGACFNSSSCYLNPPSFGQSDFDGLAGRDLSGTIFDRADANNPVADWSFVYVPYCTGDVHAGDARDATVPSVSGTQQFVGYENMRLFLQRIAPTFPGTSEVLLAGISAGGLGVAANYTQVARAFGSVPVQMLDDSGPFMEAPYLATCLQQQTRQLWNLDATVLADCGTDCPDGGDFFLPYARKVMEAYPDATFGLMDSTDDDTMTQFFGFGANDCAPVTFPTPLTATEFDAGLMDIRNQLSNEPNFGTFYFAGTQHTSLESNFATQAVDAVSMQSWVGELVDGGVSHVGP